MTVLHKNLSGTDLHESKGVAAAAANTVYVADGSGSGSFINLLPIGIVLDFCGATEPSGWLFANGETIGNATSGGTARANADTAILYALLWDSSANTELIIQDSAGAASTRGGSAAADFAANKRMPLPDYCGRTSVGRDNMGVSSQNRLTGLTGGINGDTIFATGGVESHVLTSAQLAAHTHTQQGTFTSGNESVTHTHSAGTFAVGTTITNGTQQLRNQNTQSNLTGGGGGNYIQSATEVTISLASGAVSGTSGNASVTHTHDTLISGATTSTGSDTAHNNVQPCIVMTKIIYYGQ